jgi:choice-of-anchor B domain-containing protein
LLSLIRFISGILVVSALSFAPLWIIPAAARAQTASSVQDGKRSELNAEALVLTAAVVQDRSGKFGINSKNSSAQGANCVNGMADIYPCLDITLQGHLSVAELGGIGVRLNDLWGWHDEEFGRYYILIGRSDATAIVDVTDASPRYMGEIPKTPGSSSSTWRDIKVLDHYALIVADGAKEHGMQVFDLFDLRVTDPNPIQYSVSALYTSIASSHNIVVDEESRFAYAVGSRMGGISCNGGLHMIDMADPLNPTFAGCFADVRTRRGYTHDAQCVVYHGPDLAYSNKQICLGSNESSLSIVDVTDKQSPKSLGVGEYPDARYVHQGWLTEDHTYFFQDDELDEGLVSGTRTLVWDVSDLDDPVVIKQYISPILTIDHNQYVVGNKVYQANYTSGLRVLDITDVTNPQIVQYFDTRPQDNDRSYNGAWSVYPFFDNGMLYVSSRDEGLFILAPAGIPATVISDSDIRVEGTDVQFSWATESEFKVRTFEIQERLPDHSYRLIGTVDGAGTTFSRNDYSYRLSNVSEGLHEYRIQIVAEDESRQAGPSENVVVIPGTHLITALYPNPVSDRTQLELILKESQPVKGTIYNIEGRAFGVWINEEILEGTPARYVFDTTRLPSGSYFLKIDGRTFSETLRFVVAR